MRKLYLSGLFLLIFDCLFFSGVSQNQMPNPVTAINQSQDWYEMMQDPNARFSDIQNVFYNFWRNRTDHKGNGWKVFKRWEYINESRVLPDGRLQSPGYVRNEYLRYLSQADAPSSANGNWTLVGPSQYPVNATDQPTGVGRINAIAFHPTDPNTIYIGSPSGGFWKTTDAGNSWINLSSNMPTLGVSSILIDPTDPNTIYLGSGDRDGSDAPGLGVFKSTNGGVTWTQINNTMGNVTVGAMIMHPSDPSTILAATSGGIYKTTNGGSSWTLVCNTGNAHKDIKFKPGDPTIVYSTRISSSQARFYRSTDTGDTWTQIGSADGIPAAGKRMVIGVTSADPDYVYLVQIDPTDNTFSAIILSTDSGQTFSTVAGGPNLLGYQCDGSGTASQATYDLCVAVDPSDANILYLGGINTWKSIDGGLTWNIISHWIGSTYGEPCAASLHADKHVLEWSPLNGKLYIGHDGGIDWSNDGGATWTEITNGLGINQIYKIGQSATNANLVMTGQQDNGTAVANGTTFTTVIGGDGTECLIDYTDENYRYGCYVMGEIKRSTGGSYTDIATSSNGITDAGPWVTPYFLHKSDPNTMFAGFKNVWRTNNVKASSPSSISWSAISTGETTSCIALEQSPADVNIVYVVRAGAIKRTDNANAAPGSVTWTTCSLPSGYTPTDIKAHPTDPNIVYATAQYGVYKSINKGASWSNISGTLPALFTNCLVYDKNSNEGLYVGNQTSVFYKDAGMSDWVLFSTGLPVTDIRELEIYYDPVGTQHRIKAATYGRGLWVSDLMETGVLNPTAFNASPVSATVISLGWNLNSSNNNVVLAYNTTPTFGTPVNGTSYAPSSTIPGGGTVLYNGSGSSFNHTSLTANTTYYYKIWSYNGSTQYSGGSTANATTFCTLISSFPWIESFENSGSLPACWTQEYVSGTDNWQIATAGINGHPAAPHAGSYLSRFRYITYAQEHYKTKLVSPPVDLTLVSNPVLRFWHTQELWGSNQDELRVYYRTTTTGSWNLLATYTSSIAAWTQENIQLPNASTTYYIAFEGTENAGYGVCLDDVAITTNSLTWNGTGSWTDISKWTPHYLPAVFDDVIINSGTCSLGVNASCNNVTVNNGGNLSVNPSKTLTINGTMTVIP